MALTRPFIESVRERAQSDPGFREAMFAEAVECFLNGESDTARVMLRDYVNATVGFITLADDVKKPTKSVMRMLSKSGNPSSDNLSALIASLAKREGVRLTLDVSR